jgi:hypothetical protein
MAATLKSDREARAKDERPISHWLLAVGGILLVAGGVVAWTESIYSEGHATSPTYFGLFFASVGGILFSIAVLAELFSIGSCVRRIEAHLKQADRDAH